MVTYLGEELDFGIDTILLQVSQSLLRVLQLAVFHHSMLYL